MNQPNFSATITFKDRRAPEVVLADLEATIVNIFSELPDSDHLTLQGFCTQMGAQFDLTFRYEEASPLSNIYSLKVEAYWTDNDEFQEKNAKNWFAFWTRDYQLIENYSSQKEIDSLYEKRQAQARQARSQLSTVASCQEHIIYQLQNKGATFSTAHKEGGTVIRWLTTYYSFSDYGDSSTSRHIKDDQEFLASLRQFYDSKVCANYYPGSPSDEIAWQLIARFLRKD